MSRQLDRAPRRFDPHQVAVFERFRWGFRSVHGQAMPLRRRSRVVTQSGLIAGPPTAALQPGREHVLRGAPGDERCTVAVGETHRLGVAQEDLQVAERSARRFDGLFGEMDDNVWRW